MNARKIYFIGLPVAIVCLIIGATQNGSALQSGAGNSPGAPWIIVAAVLALWGPLYLIGWVIVQVTKFSIKESADYRSWKKTLTPEERMGVEAIELTALVIAQHEVHKHLNSPEEKARRQAITDSIVHGHPGSNPWAK